MEIVPYNNKLKQRSRDLRNESTLAEVLLWKELKNQKIGFEFLRQKPIDNYIVDFFCKKLMLVIEIDGSSHDLKGVEDTFRQGQLESFGMYFLRFTNDEVKKDLYNVVRKIKRKARHLNIPRSRRLELPPSKGDRPSS
jgi:very-short-patch-repair endonuclease